MNVTLLSGVVRNRKIAQVASSILNAGVGSPRANQAVDLDGVTVQSSSSTNTDTTSTSAVDGSSGVFGYFRAVLILHLGFFGRLIAF